MSDKDKAIKFMGVNHLAMITDDLNKTVRFYRDVLGMPVVATTGNGNPREPYPYRHYFFGLGQGNTLAFFEWPGVDTGVRKDAGIPSDGRQFDHLSFGVENLEALLDLQARIKAHGADVTEVIDHDFIQSIYFTDPNGISLEASYWVVDVEKTPVWGDPNPVAAIKEQQPVTAQ